MELGPQNHNGDGLLGPNSIIVGYMDPLGYNLFKAHTNLGPQGSENGFKFLKLSRFPLTTASFQSSLGLGFR